MLLQNGQYGVFLKVFTKILTTKWKDRILLGSVFIELNQIKNYSASQIDFFVPSCLVEIVYEVQHVIRDAYDTAKSL